MDAIATEMSRELPHTDNDCKYWLNNDNDAATWLLGTLVLVIWFIFLVTAWIKSRCDRPVNLMVSEVALPVVKKG